MYSEYIDLLTKYIESVTDNNILVDYLQNELKLYKEMVKWQQN
jgi:histone deacetylase complex regulatory component SIN3